MPTAMLESAEDLVALVTGQPLAMATARDAFAFEESLYDCDIGGWLDLRDASRKGTVAAWCHGAAGIGLSALDRASSVIGTDAMFGTISWYPWVAITLLVIWSACLYG